MAAPAVLWFSFAGMTVAAPPLDRQLPPWSLPVQRPDEAPAARAVLDHLQQTLELVDADLNRIVQAADILAAALTADACHTCRVLGDVGLVTELTRLAAGRMAPGPPQDGDPVLYLLMNSTDTAAMRDALAECRSLRDAGHAVVLAASVEALRQRKLGVEAREVSDVLLDTFEPSDVGLIVLNGRPMISTQAVTLAAIGWTLRAELAAALMRHGNQPHAPAPGDVGQAYLAMLHGTLTDLGTTSWPSLVRAADRAALAIADGGRVLAVSTRPLTAAHAARRTSGDPWLVIWMDHDGAVSPTRDDFVIALGGDEPVGSAQWGRGTSLRRAGRGVCWVTCAFGAWDRGLRRGEMRLDPQWPYGASADSVAGVMTETVYCLLSAAMLERLHDLGVIRSRPTAL